MSFVANVSTGAIRAGSSVMFATYGEIISERAGIINLGVEGCMITGACTGFVVTAKTGEPYLGVLAAIASGATLAAIHAFIVISRGANQLASGLALMFLGLGLTAFVGRPYVSFKINGINDAPIPLLSDLPGIGPVLFDHDPLTYLAFLLGPAIWWVVFKTRYGLQLRAVGESVDAAFAAGLNPKRIQYMAVIAGGGLAGLGGAQLSLAYTQSWVEGMTNGRGFIAVALVIFAMWNPIRGMAGALLFGGAVAFQLQLQARGVGISPFLLDMTPYLLTIAVLLAWVRLGRDSFPAGLKEVFRGTG
ncbi:MAG TPA: ABC transporter permease [Dehalococcoidia bacterium]|nr:ABC transporter permease [Dehalococcoidia bacterium]